MLNLQKKGLAGKCLKKKEKGFRLRCSSRKSSFDLHTMLEIRAVEKSSMTSLMAE